jgi:hypothetical protein
MTKRCTAIGLAACALLTSSAALAQQVNTFATGGRVVVSGERLTGLFVNDTSIESDGNQTINDFTATDNTIDSNSVTFSFLGSTEDAGPAGIPRLALDFFVVDMISIGGSFVYSSRSNEEDQSTTYEIGNATPDEQVKTDTTTSTLAFSPRVGFGKMFTDMVGIWARGGITYIKVKQEVESDRTRDPPLDDVSSDQETNVNHFAVSLDGLLVISPINHFGFGIGPHVDIPLSGSADVEATQTTGGTTTTTDAESDVSILSYGVSAGLIGWF